MIDVRFEIGGREVRPDQFTNEIEKAVFAQVRDSVAEALTGVSCPVHGESPSVVVKGSSLDDLSWEVHGCCQELMDTALDRLA